MTRKAKEEKDKFDFTAFGEAIKAARKAKGYSRNKLSDELDISPRYIAQVENAGQHPSLQVFYMLTTFLEISADELLFPDKGVKKSTQRRQLDSLLDGVSDNGLRIITATTKEIKEIEKEGE